MCEQGEQRGLLKRKQENKILCRERSTDPTENKKEFFRSNETKSPAVTGRSTLSLQPASPINERNMRVKSRMYAATQSSLKKEEQQAIGMPRCASERMTWL